jgi:shikimate dehydrogenase
MIRLGLVGWPVSHSLSPRLHSAALQAVGLQGVYNLYPVDPLQPEKLLDLLGLLRIGELTGLNVTVPHKRLVIQLMDELTPPAHAIGAVNTVYMNNGRLVGDNTDAPGFLSDLRQKTGNLLDSPGNAIVLGAGGSSRAVAWALIGMSWRVTVAAREIAQADALAGKLNEESGGRHIIAVSLDSRSLEPLLDRTSLIVNTTPVGMVPNIESSPWPSQLMLPSEVFIYDLIYNPSPTLFVQQARKVGICAVNGLGMLIEQAALAFEIWTEMIAPRQVMFSAVGQILAEMDDLRSSTTQEE